MTLLHASCVEFMGSGLLICGRPGSGKSDLCLRLIDAGAKFVADDQTIVENREGKLTARAPDSIKGMLEIRGLGIVETPCIDKTEISLKLSLQPSAQIDRMPEKNTELIENAEIPVFYLDAFSVSAVIKIKTLLLIQNQQRKIIT
ncbi:MAG: HPr kinase/phosphorylase [Alphaproteobacteria bacterium]